jgi:SAM-dependent methyltransferase
MSEKDVKYLELIALDAPVVDQSSHLLGNYHKYYTFHSAQSRTELISGRNIFHSLWHSTGSLPIFRILDIGCNEGDLSLLILSLCRQELPSYVHIELIGADLDPHLINLAKTKAIEGENTSAFFFTVDFTSSEQVTNFSSSSEGKLFNLITVFSTTMWVHINHGDDGLRLFFTHAKSVLTEKGAILVEPQPGRCYTNAAKRCRKLVLEKPPYLHVVDKTAVMTILESIIAGALDLKKIVCLGQEDWGRSLVLFHNFDGLKIASDVAVEDLTSSPPTAITPDKNHNS